MIDTLTRNHARDLNSYLTMTIMQLSFFKKSGKYKGKKKDIGVFIERKLKDDIEKSYG